MARTALRTTAQCTTAAKQGDPQAIASLLGAVFRPHRITPKVGLRKQDHLLYVALESAQATDPDALLPLLKEALLNLSLPWLKAAEVSGRLPGQAGPLWWQALLFQTQASLDSSPRAPVSVSATPPIHIDMGEEFEGEILVGDHRHQAFYTYTHTLEHGGVLNVAAPPQVRPCPTPIDRRPQPFQNLLDRNAIIPTLVQALQSAQSIELCGAAGVGKTALLRYLVYDSQVTAAFSDGVVYVSEHPQLAKDVLQALHETFYESSAPYKPSDIQVQQALSDKQVLIVLDNLNLGKSDLDWLMAAAPSAVFIVGSPAQGDWQDGADTLTGVTLTGLPWDDSLTLVKQSLGRSLSPSEQIAVRVLWTSLSGHPLQLRRIAAQVKAQKQSLVTLATPVNADTPVSLLPRIMGGLPRSHQHLLALLGALAGSALTSAQAADIAALPDAEAILSELHELYLIEKNTAPVNHSSAENAPTVYRLCPDLIEPCQQSWPPEPWLSSALECFTHQATIDPAGQHTFQSTDTLQYLSDWSAQIGYWQDCFALSRVLDARLSLQGRWGQWQQVLEQSLQGAQHTDDRAVEAWSLHQLGTRALGEGEITTAETALTRALRLREALGDQAGAAVTRHNLGLLVSPLVSPVPMAATPISAPAPRWPKLKTTLIAVLAAAGVISLLAGIAAMQWLSRPAKPAALDLSAERLVFGERELNTPSTPQTLTLTNTGNRPLSVDSLVVNGDGDFVIDKEDCISATSLDPADSCEVGIIFKPSTTGERTATVRLRAIGNEYDIALTGSGTSDAVPGVSFDPSSLSFRELFVGNAKATRVTITNDGTASLSLETLAITGGQTAADFAIAQSGCIEVTLAPEASCTLEIQFKPGGPGARYASLTVKSNTDTDATLPLSGIGTQQPGPIAADDSAATQVNQPITLDVLTNDRDPAGGSLTLTSVAPPKTGRAKMNDDNTVTYSPGAEATQDQFSYTVRNAQGEIAKATVSVTVKAAPTPAATATSNRPPIANNDQAQTAQGTAVTLPVLANDRDPDQGDQIEIAALDGDTPSGASIGNNGDGTLTYRPAPAFTGIDRFTYTIRDRNGATTPATVEITVNGPPPPTARDDNAQTLPGQPVTIQILANDQGDDVAIASLDRVGLSGGGVSNNGDGTVNYTPPSDFNGVDTFTYTTRNRAGGISEPATVSVQVTGINRPPVANGDSNDYRYTGRPGPVLINVLANDSDPDSDSATLRVESVTQGQYTQVQISADRRAVIYTMTLPPRQDSPNGLPDSFTYTIRDADGAVSEPATVTLFGYYPAPPTPNSPPSP
ncbi:MAG: Ig-like domain-containing protein [Cyanobacteria bacterium P01_G01_bin.38]